MSARLRSESGQVLPLVAVAALVGLLAICALVIDVGAWFTKSRHVQNVADAAALAAAQDLPYDPNAAVADATTYADRNGGDLNGAPVVSATLSADDTITVNAKEAAPIIFARVLGITSATVHARAVATVSGASQINGTGAPLTGITGPGSGGSGGGGTGGGGTGGGGTGGGGGSGSPFDGRPIPVVVGADSVPPACGCSFGDTVTLSYGPSASSVPGQFGAVAFGGNSRVRDIASVLLNGYQGTLSIGTYNGVPGNKLQAGPVRNAMYTVAATHPIVLLPVASSVNGVGGTATYTVVGWAAFKIASFVASGSVQTLTGQFVRVDTPVQGPPAQYFGAGRLRLSR